jgi:hypothetical protein
VPISEFLRKEFSETVISTSKPHAAAANQSRPQPQRLGKMEPLEFDPATQRFEWKGAAVPNMDVWSWGLLGIGVFVAGTALVRLMRRRRDTLLAELTSQAREEQHQKKLAEQLEKRKQKKRAA